MTERKEDDNVKYELEESFEVDGKLEGLSKEMCFVLGVEWGRFYEQFKRNKKFDMAVHTSNLKRLENLCDRNHRTYDTVKGPEQFTKIIVYPLG